MQTIGEPLLRNDQIEANYARYKELLHPHVTPEFFSWLDASDFKESPASTKYHSSWKGGLCEHSLGTLKYLWKFVTLTPERDYSPETIVRVALLHDICKADTYSLAPRNRKIDGQWQTIMEFEFNQHMPFGHGAKSVIIAQQHGVNLSTDEILAIYHHMGAYGLDYLQLQEYSAATQQCPLVYHLHVADHYEALLHGYRKP